jgi:hypothetical protein
MAAAGFSKPAAKFTRRSPLPTQNPNSCMRGALIVSPAVRRGCPEKFSPQYNLGGLKAINPSRLART